MTDAGLRERKKSATRSALHRATLELATERGLDNVTVDDIAGAAGVSARTFFNYFATKEEAFIADDLDRARAFVGMVADAPDDVPAWRLLGDVALAVYGAEEVSSQDWARKLALLRDNADVLAHVLTALGRVDDELLAELTRRLPDAGPLLPRLLAAALGAAFRAAVEAWATSEDESSLSALLVEALHTFDPAFPAHH